MLATIALPLPSPSLSSVNIQPCPFLGLAGNLLVGGVLAAFVAGTYWKTLRNVSSDDLERELEREIAEEERWASPAASPTTLSV